MVQWKKELRALSWQQQQTPPPFSWAARLRRCCGRRAALLFLPCNRRLSCGKVLPAHSCRLGGETGLLLYAYIMCSSCPLLLLFLARHRNTSTQNHFCCLFEIKCSASALVPFLGAVPVSRVAAFHFIATLWSGRTIWAPLISLVQYFHFEITPHCVRRLSCTITQGRMPIIISQSFLKRSWWKK